MALHTMAILQAYQADVLKKMDEGTGLTPEAVKELRRAIDLALRATKHTARAVGRSMAASVAAERHLWLNLTEIREKEKVFFSLHHPEQGRRGLSFMVEGAAASRPSRHPISGMSSLAQHSASSIALLS